MKISFLVSRLIYLLRNFARKNFLGNRTVLHPVIESVKQQSITYLKEEALNDLYEQVRRVESEKLSGALIEAGCALGGSAIVMATAKSKSRPFYIYDVFGMIPPPSNVDGRDVHKRYEDIKLGKSEGIDGEKYYGYKENLIDEVESNFYKHNLHIESNNIYLVKGLFQNTLQINQDIAIAHIDGDWYESVKTCLERIAPHLVLGGTLVIDDYSSWSGCRKAVDDYFQDKRNKYKFTYKSRLHITRIN